MLVVLEPPPARPSISGTRRQAESHLSARNFVNVEVSGIFNDAQLFPLSNLPLDSRLPFCNTRLVEQVAKTKVFNSLEPYRFSSRESLHVED
jgi:hypothetical protein